MSEKHRYTFDFSKYNTIVVKVGSSTLTYDNGMINLARFELLVKVLSDLKNSGKRIILVSSGAVSAGNGKLGFLCKTDRTTVEKQAAAAVGQCELMNMYSRNFSLYGHTVAQILITKDAVENEVARNNARGTIAKLLDMGCMPIVNENDTVSFEGIRLGGNDTLAAYISILADADLLINMSDIDGLYTADPRKDENARLIPYVERISDEIMALGGGAGSERGTGGMATKLEAAVLVSVNETPVIILNGCDPRILYDVQKGDFVGTFIENKKNV